MSQVLRLRFVGGGIALAVVALFAAYVVAHLAGTPTVTTDASFYPPFSVVHISGSNLNANTSYDVVVQLPDGTVVVGDGSESPIPPAPYDTAVADGAGNLQFDYQLSDFSGLYNVYLYKSSDIGHNQVVAFTTFWDPTLSQCADGSPHAVTCSWQFGDLNGSNSSYGEGDVIPFRWELSGMAAGSTHTFHLNYDFSKGGPKAYDFLTSYNVTETGADVCGASQAPGLCPLPGAPPVQPPQCVTFPIESFNAPSPLNVAGAIAQSGLTPAQRCLGIYGATITSMRRRRTLRARGCRVGQTPRTSWSRSM